MTNEIDVSLLTPREMNASDSVIGLDASEQTVRVQIPELTVEDITNKTTKKGLVSGADLDGLGGGGTRLNPFLYSGVQYPVGSGMREHKLVAADLPTGTEPVFILAYSSAGEVSKVCIPKVADLPALAEVDTIRFFLEAGVGSVEFSNTETGVALGTTITGGSRLTGAGCLIARNLGMDVWGVSYEASQPSGPEVLKDWTGAIPSPTGVELTPNIKLTSLEGVTVEYRFKSAALGSGNLTCGIVARSTGGVASTRNKAKTTLSTTTSENVTEGLATGAHPNYLFRSAHTDPLVFMEGFISFTSLTAAPMFKLMGKGSNLAVNGTDTAEEASTNDYIIVTGSAVDDLTEIWFHDPYSLVTDFEYRIIRN